MVGKKSSCDECVGWDLVKFVVHTSTVIADVVFVSECNEKNEKKNEKMDSILYENDKSGN